MTSSDFFPPVFSEFDLCRQPTCCGFSGVVPFFTADIPRPRQMLINTLMYWSLPLIHLPPLLWTDSLLQKPCSFYFPLFKCKPLSTCLFRTFYIKYSRLHRLSGMTNIISATNCKDESSWVISQPYTLIYFMNSKKNFEEFKRDLTELRWLEEVMMQKSFEKNKNETQTVKK